MQQRADPQLLLTNRLLQMSALELQQCLTHEVSENPALDAVDDRRCLECDLLGRQCGQCALWAAALASAEGPRPAKGSDLPPAEDLDTLDLVESPQTLRDHLLAQWGSVAGERLLALGQYLIDNLDDDGYLRCNLDDVAQALGLRPEAAAEALQRLQTLDPTGVGARSLQECLLIQARAGRVEGTAPPHVEVILERYWKELAAGKWPVIARGLKVTVAEAEALGSWIRGHLKPYPGSAYRPSWQRATANRQPRVRPDVTVTLDEEGQLQLIVVGDELPDVQLNTRYARLWQRMRDQPDRYSEAERRHVSDYVQRAQMFMKSLGDRQTILRRVAKMMVEEQEAYFRFEQEEDLRPLTQSQLSTFLQVHESTISRALADKFLQMPSGRVVPLSFFFDRALGVRKLVANVVASEDPKAPYSDQDIADILRRQGVTVARRTVMKYREEMNILSSRQRGRMQAV